MVRADKQRRSAIHNFGKWYTQLSSQFWDSSFPVGIDTSPLNITRRALPHTLLYFLIQVLQRMLHQFWDTAQQDPYVLKCGAANGRCPPSIIAVLFYYECTVLSPFDAVSTKKRRLDAGSEAAASSGDAATAKAARDVFWQTFAENVMQHLVWPAVKQGVIRVAPRSDRDNPDWWSQDILPILEDSAVWSLYWLGGKKMSRNSWYHVCEVLATYDFPAVVRPEPFTQKSVQEFLEAAEYHKVIATDDAAARPAPLAARSKAASSMSSGSSPTLVPVRGAAAAASALKRPAGVGYLIAAPPAAAALPCQSRIEQARHLTDFARRFAYSELDQHARRTIASAQ